MGPHIRAAALEIAYDNGMINRYRSQESFLEGVESVLGAEGVYAEDVEALERFLSGLSKGEIETLCCGEHTEMKEIEACAPKNARGEPVTGLLNDIFNMGCEHG